MLALRTHILLSLVDCTVPFVVFITSPEVRMAFSCLSCILYSSVFPLIVVTMNFKVVGRFANWASLRQALLDVWRSARSLVTSRD